MTDVVRDAIAADLALLERVLPAGAEPVGYGRDLSCVADLTPTMASVDPFSPTAIAESLARRFGTPRGALIHDPDFGLDLRAYLNQGTTAAEVRALADRIRVEAQKDDRVLSAAVTVTPSSTGSSLRIDIRIRPADPRVGGPFRLTLAVTSAEVLLEELRAA